MFKSPRGTRVLPLVIVLTAAIAHAETPAETAFQRGKEALQVGKYDEACTAFQESQRLDPQPTTQFNIALCSEQLGKIGTALAIHRELATVPDNPRRGMSAELAAKLEGRAPRLRIDLAKSVRKAVAKRLKVTVNGIAAPDLLDIPIDVGTNRVVAVARGYKEWTGEVTAGTEKSKQTITIRLERDPDATDDPDTLEPDEPGPGASPPGQPPPEAPRDRGGSVRKPIGGATMILGGLAVGGGLAMGYLARDKWQQATDLCPGSVCPDPDTLVTANELRDQARSRGNLATALAVGGGVFVVGGFLLWATAPSAEPRIALAPSVTPTSAYVTLRGSF